MTIKVNGESAALERPSLTLADLLTLNKVENPEMVSVQLNGKFVESRLYAATVLGENDEIDFLYYLGGGRGQ